MINIQDYPEVINRIGISNLSDAHKKAHEFISDGSDNFTNMQQMAELMEADADIRKATEKYLQQLEDQFNTPEPAPEPATTKKPRHKTQSARKGVRKSPIKKKKAPTKPILVDYVRDDDWSRKLYKSDNGTFYVDIDDNGNFHTISKEGEPDWPAPNVKIRKDKPAPKAEKKTRKPKAPKAPKAPAPAPEPDNRTRVNKVPASVAYMNRCRLMDGKVMHKTGPRSLLTFISSLQKAIEEQVIRKTDKYAAEIMDMQNSLVKLFNDWQGNAMHKIEIAKYDHYMSIVRSYVVTPLTMLIKRFIRLQGKPDVKKEAGNLVKAIQKAIDRKEIVKPDVADMLVSLNNYIDGKTNSIAISSHALSGLMGLAGIGKKKNEKDEILVYNDGVYSPYTITGDILRYINDDDFEIIEFIPIEFESNKAKKWFNENYDRVQDAFMEIKDSLGKVRGNKSKKAAGRPNAKQPATNNVNGFEQTFQQGDKSIKAGDYVETPMGDCGTVTRISGRLAHIKDDKGVSHTVPVKMLKKVRQTTMAGLNGAGDVMNSMQLKSMQFSSLGLDGKYGELIGDPAEPWSMMVYGAPGSGKSTLSIEFAHELAANHNRKIAYVAKEEGIGATIQEKFARMNAFHPNIDIHSNRLPEHPEQYQYIFVDSVNELGIDYETLSGLQKEWQAKGVNPVYIFKGTKDGSFRGSQEYEHLVDVSIKTEEGIARTEKSRYGGKGALVVYTDDSQNTPKFSDLIKAEGYRNKAKNKMHITRGDDGKYWVITPAMASLMKGQGFEIF